MAEVNKLFFGVKYIFRFFHIFAFAMVFGNVSYDLFVKIRVTGQDTYKGVNQGLNIFFYVLIMISGLVNMILLVIEKKFIKDFQYEIWKKSLIVKFILTLFVTPLLEALISISVNEQDKIDSIALPIKFTLMLIFTLASPFLRFYREYYLTPGPPESYIKYREPNFHSCGDKISHQRKLEKPDNFTNMDDFNVQSQEKLLNY